MQKYLTGELLTEDKIDNTALTEGFPHIRLQQQPFQERSLNSKLIL
jgi:hypothetical protein